MTRTWASSLCLALLVGGAAHAQSDDPNPCRKGNMGSSRGAGACLDLKLREAEKKLAVLESSYKTKLLAAAANPESAEKLLTEEGQAWHAYRGAKCALQGDMEGGEDAWKNVWAISCEVTETEARSKALRMGMRKN